MSIHVEDNLIHWNYYLALEEDLARASRYIEFNKANFETFSLELTHILLAASSEVDVVLKALCNLLSPDARNKNINDYKVTIKDKCTELISEVILSPRYGLELTPWEGWKNDLNPAWWTSYNNVKHQRDKYYSEANLKNTLDALAALKVVTLYFFKTKFEIDSEQLTHRDVTKHLVPKGSLFQFKPDYYYHTYMVSPG